MPLPSTTPPPETGRIACGGVEVPYIIVRSRRRRRTISLSVDHGKNLRIQAPVRTPFPEIKKLLLRKSGWIAGRLSGRGAAPPYIEPRSFENGQTAAYLGESYRVHAVYNAAAPAGCRLVEDRLEVNLRKAKPGKADKKLQAEIIKFYRQEAAAFLRARLDHWAKILRLRYRHLAIGNARRLWGTCSARNDIRINWRILMAPEPLIDYLLAHELCHVAHKNHSRRFWALLESVMPDHKQRRKQLHTLGPGLLSRGRAV